MKEIYSSIPEEVSIFTIGEKTDVILRKNIEQVTKTEGDDSYQVYECDEVQFRYNGTLTKKEVQSNFDKWWNYDPNSDVSVENKLQSLEAKIDSKVDEATLYETILAAYREGVNSL